MVIVRGAQRLIGSCLDLADPSRGRICGSLDLQRICRPTLHRAGSLHRNCNDDNPVLYLCGRFKSAAVVAGLQLHARLGQPGLGEAPRCRQVPPLQ